MMNLSLFCGVRYTGIQRRSRLGENINEFTNFQAEYVGDVRKKKGKKTPKDTKSKLMKISWMGHRSTTNKEKSLCD